MRLRPAVPARAALAAVIAIASLAGVPAPAAAAGCSLAPTNGTVTRAIGTRTYTVHVPAGLSGPSVPLLVAIHGNTGNSAQHESFTGWTPFSDRNGFIVAYPQGLANQWNTNQGSPDVAFLRQVVDHVSATWCVNPKAVFADGHSQGAMMSQRIACDAEDKFAAVVTFAGSDATLFGSPCTVTRPIGVGIFHGYSDPIVPWSWDLHSANLWRGAARDRCAATTNQSDAYGTLAKHTACSAGVQVWLRLIYLQGHLWPTGAKGEDTRTKMWAFLNAHRLP